jgi:hypothetical protein
MQEAWRDHHIAMADGEIGVLDESAASARRLAELLVITLSAATRHRRADAILRPFRRPSTARP